ncbi:hypothetical protein HNY73_020640 [Argiope bruennichi]|uniref:Uncharacterized protein n=1 Tax=Argiope bruennichi TaxID=94029 RepID=A0A8T0E8B7_ARGBR|nr:hypothetical protein HNY73_020640 [Argiope bruennichi]
MHYFTHRHLPAHIAFEHPIHSLNPQFDSAMIYQHLCLAFQIHLPKNTFNTHPHALPTPTTKQHSPPCITHTDNEATLTPMHYPTNRQRSNTHPHALPTPTTKQHSPPCINPHRQRSTLTPMHYPTDNEATLTPHAITHTDNESNNSPPCITHTDHNEATLTPMHYPHRQRSNTHPHALPTPTTKQHSPPCITHTDNEATLTPCIAHSNNYFPIHLSDLKHPLLSNSVIHSYQLFLIGSILSLSYHTLLTISQYSDPTYYLVP